MIGRTIRILMGAAPPDIEFDALIQAMESVDGVEEIHHVHVCELNERDRSVEAHVVIRASDMDRMETIKSKMIHLIGELFRYITSKDRNGGRKGRSGLGQ